ncbi:MAG: NADH-quinone oxidoreductase subunit N [Gracilimonas sp.]|uniref:NADH-quinone oxidoreductase subunit N n=1 Tax=Gracilimonas sp. TaxID=1974203 RepID=UPI0037533535|nr:NADH-quinone oxidoreductase subunit N [Gracilimonas sp.]
MDYLGDIQAFLPGVITAVAGLVVIVVESFKKESPLNFWITVVSLAAALFISLQALDTNLNTAFSGMLVYGGPVAFGNMIILAGALFSVFISEDYLRGIGHYYGETYALILFATTGMLALAGSNDLVTLFLGLETMSICLYVMAGLIKDEKSGAESALKYFLLGAFSTGFLLYGMALLYGATGTTSIPEIGAAASTNLLFLAGTGLLLVGFLFKISAVPFHMWTPDVYQGTPTTLTAYFATASKAATFIAFILVLSRALPIMEGLNWQLVLSVISIITMVFGNIIALVQDNVKRMLAYSSIAHAGYVLVGLAAGTIEGYSAVLFYLFAYTIMNVGAFGVIAYYERNKGLDFNQVQNLAGLGYKEPLMGISLSVFLFSLAGIPPLVGFVGKYYVFAAAINAEMIGLAIVGVLASAASVYYYLRVMVYLYFREEHQPIQLFTPTLLYKGTIAVLAILALYYGIEPLLPGEGLMDILNTYGGYSTPFM